MNKFFLMYIYKKLPMNNQRPDLKNINLMKSKFV